VSELTGRERVRRAITFTGPDRVPIHHAVFPGAFERHGRAPVEILDQYPDDLGKHARLAAAPPPRRRAGMSSSTPTGGRWIPWRTCARSAWMF
jgi:hypothetical protein